MKERAIRERKSVKAGEVFEHSVIELNGQRLRVDRRTSEKKMGRRVVIFRQIPNGRRRTRVWELNPAKKVTLCLR